MSIASYIIGQRYPVRLVVGTWGSQFEQPWPVFTPVHSDAEHINFPHDHWHIDWRFVPASMYRKALASIKRDIDRLDHVPAAVRLYARPLMKNWANHLELVAPRRYLRPHPNYYQGARWLPALTEAMADRRMVDRICPHRGASLCGIEPDADGIIECPAHGLRWRVDTGEVVRSAR